MIAKEFNTAQSRARLFCADSENVGAGAFPVNLCAVFTDPPYGMNAKVNYKGKKRSGLAECNDFDPIVGDDKPFDPQPWLQFPIVILFGANHYCDNLPTSRGWIIWDKLDGLKTDKREIGFNDNADCEMIWTNRDMPARLIRHRWMGAMKASEHGQKRLHPTQKPIELLRIIIRNYIPEGTIILDPYAGVFSCGLAAILEGYDYIGIEIEPKYYEIGVTRIENLVKNMENQARQLRLL